MSDVVAGPPPTRVWAVRFQDGGGWRLIGDPETMRVLRARGDVKEEREYVPMSAPLAQHLGYGDANTVERAHRAALEAAVHAGALSPDALESDEPEDPDVAAALARTRYAGALPLGLAKERRREAAAALDGDGVRAQAAMERALDGGFDVTGHVP